MIQMPSLHWQRLRGRAHLVFRKSKDTVIHIVQWMPFAWEVICCLTSCSSDPVSGVYLSEAMALAFQLCGHMEEIHFIKRRALTREFKFFPERVSN